jgi:acyl-CoA thioester hydrolase
MADHTEIEMTPSRNRNSSPMPPGAHATRLRVRYAETDQMGVAHHANYLVWFEAARSAFMRDAGIPYGDLEEQGCFLRVIEAGCRLLAPAHFDEELTVHTWMQEMRSRKIAFAYEVMRDGRSLARGHTIHVTTDESGKVIRLPAEMRQVLQRYA